MKTTTAKAPRIGASDMIERVRAEMIQIGNRVPAARREMDDLEPLVAKIGHYYDGIIEPLRAVFEETALALGCLPPTFPDANGHVLEKAKAIAEENRALKAERPLLKEGKLLARIAALEEENRRLREEMDSPAHIRSLATPETLEGMAQDYPFAAGLLTAAADMIRARR